MEWQSDGQRVIRRHGCEPTRYASTPAVTRRPRRRIGALRAPVVPGPGRRPAGSVDRPVAAGPGSGPPDRLALQDGPLQGDESGTRRTPACQASPTGSGGAGAVVSARRANGFEPGELEPMLAELPRLEREIVVARIWGELSFEQIAELVERSTSAVHRGTACVDTAGRNDERQTRYIEMMP